jgi:hypothetical protein
MFFIHNLYHALHAFHRTSIPIATKMRPILRQLFNYKHILKSD